MKRILLFSLVLIFLSSFTYAALTDGLYAAYTFENTATLEDVFGTNDSIDLSITTKGVTDPWGGNTAWDFVSGDYVEMDISILQGLGIMSFYCIVNFDSLTGDPAIIYAERLTPDLQQSRKLADSPTVFYNQLYTTGGLVTDSRTIPQLYTGSWYGFGESYDGTKKNTIFNNTMYPNVAQTGTIDLSGGTFAFGKSIRVGSNTFDGKFAQCLFWNRAIDQTDVNELYDNTTNTFYEYVVTPPSTNAPQISNVICTSCLAGTNTTYDTTPTFNITLDIDGMGCISNESTGNYSDCVARGGIGVNGEVDTKVIVTLPSNQSLTAYYEWQTMYFWANSSSGIYSPVYNLTSLVMLINRKPSNPTILYPVNGETYYSSPTYINYYSTDLDGQTIYYNVYVNDTLNISLITTNVTSWNISDEDNYYKLSVSATDLINSSDNTTIYFTIIKPTLFLDGLQQNRTYEYQTTANITSNQLITIYDNTFRYIDQTSPFLYLIDLLRINKFNDNTLSKNVSSGTKASINIDSRTDLYNVSFNITGYNSPSNITLIYPNTIIIPGTLLYNILYQDKFIFENTIYNSYNLSFVEADSKVIYVNFSNQGNPLTRNGTLNFTITAFNLDTDNEFNYQENFSDSNFINLTSLSSSSAPMSIFDDLESTTLGRWICTNVSACPGSYCRCERINITGGDSYFLQYTYSAWGGFSSDSQSSRVDINAPEITLSNISKFNFSVKLGYSYGRQNSHSSSSSMNIQATDGTTTINLWDFSTSGSGFGSGGSFWDYNFHGFKNPDGTWDTYLNGTQEKNDLSLASLNEPITLRITTAASGNAGGSPGSGTASTYIYVYNINTSGIRLNRTEGVYSVNQNGIFESNNLTTTTNDIARGYLSATVYNPSNTNVLYYLSADGGQNYEEVLLNNFHTFVNTGKSPKVKFVINSSDNYTSPLINSYTFEIISASPSNLQIDIGNDGITDMNLPIELNSSTTPLKYNGTDEGLNNYINSSCNDTYCLIPISFIIGSGGLLQISDLNISQNINPIRLNASILQDYNIINITPTYTSGTLELNDLKLDYRGSKNITVSTSSLNLSLSVKYSPFNITYPSNVDYWEIFPNKANESNIQPYGQNKSTGIWNINSQAYDGDIDIYSRYNNSIDSCVTIMNFRGQNFTRIPNNNSISSLNITTLTTTNQKLVESLGTNINANIRTYTQINCSNNPSAFIIPYFCFNSLCSECVKTYDYQDDCDVME